jgi:hypothetical protein
MGTTFRATGTSISGSCGFRNGISGFLWKRGTITSFGNIIAVLGTKKTKLNFFSDLSAELKLKPGFF